MNILVFSQYYFPENFLINDIASDLVARGNHVTVITGKPNYPTGVIPKEYKGCKKSEEIIDGVNVIRCNIIPRGQSHIQLFLNYLSYAIRAQLKASKLFETYDIVFAYQLTPITLLIPAVEYARKHKLKTLCYALDLAPLSGLDTRIVNNSFVYGLYHSLSKKLYNRCDKIGVTTQNFIDYLNSVNAVPQNKLFYLPQHAHCSLLETDLDKIPNGEIVFMYAGSIVPGSKIDVIVEAAHLLSKQCQNFKVVIVGDGQEKDRLVKLAEEYSLQGLIEFQNSVPMEEMTKKYRIADALIVSLRKGQFTIPGKLQAYMATGKPIIGCLDGPGREIINQANCGISVSAEDTVALCDAMYRMFVSYDIYREMGMNGRKYFREHFTLKTFNDHLLMELRKTYEGASN